MTREEAIEIIQKLIGRFKSDSRTYKALEMAIQALSQEQKSGKWRRVSIEKYIQHAMAYYECSECGGQTIGEPKYCPNCGAKMESEDKE